MVGEAGEGGSDEVGRGGGGGRGEEGQGEGGEEFHLRCRGGR